MNVNSNVLRLIIGLILGGLLIFGSFTLANNLIAAKKKPQAQIEKKVNKVYTQTVENTSIPIIIQEKGNLQALRKVELFAEVQGQLLPANLLFKPGQRYGKDAILFQIDDAEFAASLKAQKSSLFNLIAQSMPDLKLDFPEAFPHWNNYLKNFDVNQAVPELPNFTSDKEKFYINSRNIVTTYYNIKNLEERHKKYIIRAPFPSIVTESSVHPGSLIRPGQKLGSIIQPGLYELPVSINHSFKEYLAIGKKVKLYNLHRDQSWTGRIARIDGTVNTTTQGILAYIEVSGNDLREGMYLEADLEGNSVDEGFEVSRKLLVNNESIYIIEDNQLKLFPVEVAFFKQRTAIITNLPEGTLLLKNPIPGAYQGMLVETIHQ